MRLILSRHGNTFAAGDKAVWVGRRTDLPLVAEGLAQARRLGRALKEAGIALAGLYCGPLQRTRHHAEIAAKEAGSALVPTVEPCLLELDYGAWEGLTNAEIAAGPGAADLAAWERRSLWPASPGWSPAEAEVAAGVADFARRIAAAHKPGDTVLAVASNGVLRYFLRLAPGAFGRQAAAAGGVKVATGNVCLLEAGPDGVAVTAWNVPPDAALFARPAGEGLHAPSGQG